MIAVVDYHKGNLKSVERALVGVGLDARITDDVRAIHDAQAIVLPGVGSFTDAATSMHELDQMDVVRERIHAGVPFLGICLGEHLLFEGGIEHAKDPDVPTPGLGILPGIVGDLPRYDSEGNAYKIPHVGWNTVDPIQTGNPLFVGLDSGEYFYFTHSYCVPESEGTIATTTHSITFPSVVQYGDVCFGVQFHPEKSSDVGIRLLKNFARIMKDGVA